MAEREGAFALNHPVVPAVYLLATLGLTMLSLHPVLVGCSLVGGLLYCCLAEGVVSTLQSLRWQFPLILLIALFNPLFSASGSTELFRIGLRAVYAESLFYGCCMGALFVASVTWFRAGASMLSLDKVMALFGNLAPTICLMVSMCMRLIPKFVRRGRLILATQDAAGVGQGGSRRNRVESRLRASSALMGWGMEDSLETADAMRARGWGAAPRRSSYTRYRFTLRDFIALVLLLAAGFACAWIVMRACRMFSFYPTVTGLFFSWGYVFCAVWMLLPSAVLVFERRVFR